MLIVASTYPPRIGGAETYARNVAHGLARRGHCVTVVTDGTDGVEGTNDGAVAVVRLRDYWSRITDPDLVRWEQMVFSPTEEFGASGRHQGIDIVHANSHDAAVFGSIIALASHTPLVCTYHEQTPEAGPFGHGRCELAYRYLPIVRIISGSSFYYEKSLQFGATRERARLVYHGIDETLVPDMPRREARAKMLMPADAEIVACSARLTPRKGLSDLIDAAALLAPSRPQLRVVIAGTANSSSRAFADSLYAQIEALELASVVTIDEGVSLDEIGFLYRAADIVVQPSLAEGLGLAVIEAMHAGRPIVATRIPGLVEVIDDGDTGLLVSPRAPQELAAAVDRLLGDRELRSALGAHARDIARERFGFARMIAETEAVYAEAILAAKRPDHEYDPERRS